MNRLCNGDSPLFLGGSEPGAESSSGNVVPPGCGEAAGAVLAGSLTGDAIAFDVLPLAIQTPAEGVSIARSKRFTASAFEVTRRAMMSDAEAVWP